MNDVERLDRLVDLALEHLVPVHPRSRRAGGPSYLFRREPPRRAFQAVEEPTEQPDAIQEPPEIEEPRAVALVDPRT